MSVVRGRAEVSRLPREFAILTHLIYKVRRVAEVGPTDTLLGRLDVLGSGRGHNLVLQVVWSR